MTSSSQRRRCRSSASVGRRPMNASGPVWLSAVESGASASYCSSSSFSIATIIRRSWRLQKASDQPCARAPRRMAIMPPIAKRTRSGSSRTCTSLGVGGFCGMAGGGAVVTFLPVKEGMAYTCTNRFQVLLNAKRLRSRARGHGH
eukprot:5263013-Prymnesium_polylepis.1